MTQRSARHRELVPWNPFAYVAWQMRRCLAVLVDGAALPPQARVLDYGCDDKPYRSLFPASCEYVGADLPGNPNADAEIDSDGSVPVDDETFDLVISTQVLEHVDDPAAYLAEAFRVLRPGGQIVLSTHGMMYLHRDPQDYWRWTSDGLAKIVSDAGFAVETTAGVLGLVPVGLQLIQTGVARRTPRVLLRPLIVFFQLAIGLSDLVYDEDSRRDFGMVIALRARKPGRVEG